MAIRFAVVFLIVSSLFATNLQAAEMIGGYPPDEALRLGERLYREGILPSGKPSKALVMGDIPVDGQMFTCDDCHQRSGLGSEEGTVITYPTNGRSLALPRTRTGAYKSSPARVNDPGGRPEIPEYYKKIPAVRPPYTDQTLAKVIRAGIDSAGNKVDPVMPRYPLGADGMEILIYYLKNLSLDLSPGVDDTTIQFATVIGGDVPERERTSMLSVLQAYFDIHNSQMRYQDRRAQAGPFFESEMNLAYKKIQLHVWELQGPEETWKAQLDTYYQKNPVFALLGGLSTGNWEVIHSFSEEHKIPCIFPLTDLPVLSASDWQTLYFSKGYYQEGENAAKYLHNTLGKKADFSVIQVYDRKDKSGAALAKGFTTAWRKAGGSTVQELLLNDINTLSEQALHDLFSGPRQVVLLLWLGDSRSVAYQRLSEYIPGTHLTFTSTTLLHNDLSTVPDEIREKMLFTYPYSTEEDDKRTRLVVRQWLKARKIPALDFNIQARTYFLGWMLEGAIMGLRSEYYRDYFLEQFDMMPDQDYAIAVYPRLSFGPGQRYAVKQGCYIVKIGKGRNAEMTPVSEWMMY